MKRKIQKAGILLLSAFMLTGCGNSIHEPVENYTAYTNHIKDANGFYYSEGIETYPESALTTITLNTDYGIYSLGNDMYEFLYNFAPSYEISSTKNTVTIVLTDTQISMWNSLIADSSYNNIAANGNHIFVDTYFDPSFSSNLAKTLTLMQIQARLSGESSFTVYVGLADEENATLTFLLY